MKTFIDGDQMVVVKDDFVSLQESPAVFIPRDSENGRTLEDGGVLMLPLGVLRDIRNQLAQMG